MTNLPRLTVSLPPDIEKVINDMKREPENEHVPKSKLFCELIRRGMERGAHNSAVVCDDGQNARTPPD